MPDARTTAARERMSGMMRSALTENLTYKGVALFVSVVLWYIVESQLPPPTEVMATVVIEKDANLELARKLPDVRVTLKSRRQVDLSSDAVQLRLEFESDVPDSVTVVVRKRDILHPRGMEVIDISPSSFVVYFDSIMRKSVPVRSALRLSAAEGVAIYGSPRFDPESVDVVGHRQAVVNIHSVSTVARDYVVRDSAPVTVMLANPAPGIDVAPADVKMRVNVVKMFQP